MVTYSQWQPDGGYNYFEASGQTAPLGNDLPVARLHPVGKLGVPSVEAGHPIPPGARYAGEGDLPVGIVAPMDSSRAQGAWDVMSSPWAWFAAGVAVTLVVSWLARRR